MYEVKIYGEIVPSNDEFIEVEGKGGYCTLSYLQKQLLEAKGQPVRVRINSVGGDVNAGFAMYAELRRYAKQHGVAIETFGEAYVASIATIIFLAGDRRVLTAHTSPFIHNAWTGLEGDFRDFRQTAEELETCSDLMAKHYEAHTSLTYEDARALMDGNTSVTVEDALAMGFATDIERLEKPKALKGVLSRCKMSINKQKENMAKNEVSIGSRLKALGEFLFTTFKALKEVTAADETVVTFPDIEADAEPQTGDKATINGEPANGNVVMKSGETYVFTDGELAEIIPADEETYDEPTDEQVMASAKYKELEAKFKESETQSVQAVQLAETMKAKLEELKNIKSPSAKAANRDKPDPTKNAKNEPTETKAAKALAALKNRDAKK